MYAPLDGTTRFLVLVSSRRRVCLPGQTVGRRGRAAPGGRRRAAHRPVRTDPFTVYFFERGAPGAGAMGRLRRAATLRYLKGFNRGEVLLRAGRSERFIYGAVQNGRSVLSIT